MKRYAVLVLASTLIASCSGEVRRERKRPPSDAVGVSAPVGSQPTREEIAKQRRDAAWRQQQSFREALVRRTANAAVRAKAAATATDVNLKFVTDPKFRESLRGIEASLIEDAPIRVPIQGDVSGPSVLRVQILLDRANYSVGPIDGNWGKNSEIAVYWFQEQHGLSPTGDVDESTFRAIAAVSPGPVLVMHTLNDDEVKGPFVALPDSVYEQEALSCMCYESLAEKLAEKFHTTEETLEVLNPGVNLRSLEAGAQIRVPAVRSPAPGNAAKDIARIAVSIEGNYFHGHDAVGNIVFHAPTTVGSKYDPSPTETLSVVRIIPMPHFKYQPKLYSEVPDDKPEADLQPGPNSPVGVVWIALSKAHYGIHGTAYPDTIGYASSHGCIRLANWDALDIARRIAGGTKVDFVDTRH